jgi:hypothetical protein
MDYIIERVASGGIISNMAAAEGLVCKFTGTFISPLESLASNVRKVLELSICKPEMPLLLLLY